MGNRRIQGLLGIAAIAVGVLAAAAFGVFLFVHTWSRPLHSDPQSVPTVAADAGPAPRWTGAVERARQAARASLVEQNLPGLSVAVGVGGALVWAEGFGWADVDSRVPVSPATRFRLGHASIPLTSAAVGLLLEQGRLRLDEEIQTYVPTFPRKAWPITLRQLMGHVAGLRHYRSEADYRLTTHCERASEGVASFADDPLLFEPETQHQYSTYGWVLVSAAIEAATGEPFYTFMQGQIFHPLGMTDTTSDTGSAPMPNRVTFYYPAFSGDPSLGAESAQAVDYSCFAGAGGFLTTPSDMVRFGVALDGGALIKRPTITKFRAPQILASGKETDYGLGWTVETLSLGGEPTLMASHASRTLLGGSTSFLTFPERGLVVAVMSNVSFAGTRSIALQIAEAFAAARATSRLGLRGQEAQAAAHAGASYRMSRTSSRTGPAGERSVTTSPTLAFSNDAASGDRHDTRVLPESSSSIPTIVTSRSPSVSWR